MAKQVVGQPRYLKEVNQNIIDRLIIDKGPLTKPQIAALTGLSLPTVNKIVDMLEEENKVRSIGTTGNGVGRRAQLYQTNEDSGNVLTVYISQGTMICCVVNMVGVVIYRFSVNISKEIDPLEALITSVERMQQNCVAPAVAIGIGIPGVVDEKGIVSCIPSIPQWEGICLKDELDKKFTIPSYVENNAKLTAIGFYNTQLKPKYRDVVYLHIGQGISSGIILDTKLHKGFSSFAGELGYMLVEKEDGRNNLEGVLYKLINDYRNEHDPVSASEIRSKLFGYIAKIIVNYICVLNPEVVVIRGGIINGDFPDELKSKILQFIPEHCLPKLLIDTSEFSSIKGIVAACRQFISPSFDIVEDGKV